MEHTNTRDVGNSIKNADEVVPIASGLHLGDTNGVAKMAALVALATVLQMLESFIPGPVPGLKLGLANVATLLAFLLFGARAAFEVSVSRVLLTSILTGSFLSPGFMLSFCSAIAGTSAMAVIFSFQRVLNRQFLSLIGISVVGAFVHNLAQLCAAYALIIRHKGVFVFLPWLSMGAVFTGCLTALIASRVYLKIVAGEAPVSSEKPLAEPSFFQSGAPDSFLRRLNPGLKISAAVTIIASALLSTDIKFYCVLALVLLPIILFQKGIRNEFKSKCRGYAFIAAVSFLVPMLFDRDAGFISGTVSFMRTLVVILSSFLLTATTDKSDIFVFVRGILKALRINGGGRSVEVFSMAWDNVGFFWGSAVRAVKAVKPSDLRGAGNVIDVVSRLLYKLYFDGMAYPAACAGKAGAQ
jgi:heptaprenyl diphosphate synthase